MKNYKIRSQKMVPLCLVSLFLLMAVVKYTFVSFELPMSIGAICVFAISIVFLYQNISVGHSVYISSDTIIIPYGTMRLRKAKLRRAEVHVGVVRAKFPKKQQWICLEWGKKRALFRFEEFGNSLQGLLNDLGIEEK